MLLLQSVYLVLLLLPCMLHLWVDYILGIRSARWSIKAFFVLALLIPVASTKYRKFLSCFPHLWATHVDFSLAVNSDIDGIPKFVTAIWYKCCENFVVVLVIVSVLVFAKLLTVNVGTIIIIFQQFPYEVR